MVLHASPARWSLALLAGTALASPAFAQATEPAAPPVAQGQPAATPDSDSSEIVITAQKREENLQDVPISVQAIGTRRLDQLNISNFEDYSKQLPSVSFQSAGPGSAIVYMRGIATGGDGNHSGSQPSVGTYLDEQPVTTIGGTLDVHIYDIARIESLAGPQGTLYGASSQAGTIRIITNKPELGVTSGRVDAEVNRTWHGDFGGSLEGMINLPVSDNMALRAVGFAERNAGFIDNVAASRTYISDDGDITVDNDEFVEKDINSVRTFGGRAALKIDLDENWTVTPTVMHQNQKSSGVFFYDPDLPGLSAERFADDRGRDKWTQAALTVEGKIANFDLTYSGAYLDRKANGFTDYTDYTDAYEAYYIDASGVGLIDYQRYLDNNGNNINPQQFIDGSNHYRKMSHEVRLASPADKPLRAIVGAYFSRTKNNIFQDYIVPGLADDLSVDTRPGTIWLTKQKREDKDYALFGEVSFDVTPQFTITGGGRLFKFDNSLFGFAGFGSDNPGGFSSGVGRCIVANGQAANSPTASGAIVVTGSLPGTPCTNVGNLVDGKLVPRRSKGDGFTHRLNAQYKFTDDVMVYATWSRGFRPGGINRQPVAPAYDPDYLTNYELGWKTSFGPVRWNGAIYRQRWEGFQFSFLGENSLTVIQNGRDAIVKGIETDLNYTVGGLTLNAAAAYTDAKTKGNICNFSLGNEDCSGLDSRGRRDFVVTPDGSRLPVTPRFKGSATARYAWLLGPGRAHVQGSVSYQGSAAADIRRNAGSFSSPIDPNSVLGRVKSSTLVDLFAGFDWAKYNVELFATNLFDEKTELTRAVACSICTNTRVYIGRPRTIGLRFGTKF
ncbi:TonB-dependent receptor [Sphingomonas swuensis]|uniref:TonB-dependent receptor n=1 Tax=Sphingomonas swuensis TaxID=977800 RepID=A0ABP7TC22_9SPHN